MSRSHLASPLRDILSCCGAKGPWNPYQAGLAQDVHLVHSLLLRPPPCNLPGGIAAGRRYNAAARQAHEEESLEGSGAHGAEDSAALDQQSHGQAESSHTRASGPTLYPPDTAQAEPPLARSRAPRQHSSPSQRLAAALKSMGPPSLQNPYLQGPNLRTAHEPYAESLQDAPGSWSGPGSLERGAHYRAPGNSRNVANAARRMRTDRKDHISWFNDDEPGHSEEGAADGRQGSGYGQQPRRGAEPWWLQAARGHARPAQMPEPGSEPLYVPQHMQRPYGHRGQHLNGAGSARPAWQHRESETRQPGSHRPPGPYLNGQHRGRPLNGSDNYSRSRPTQSQAPWGASNRPVPSSNWMASNSPEDDEFWPADPEFQGSNPDGPRQQPQQQPRPGWQNQAPSQQWDERTSDPQYSRQPQQPRPGWQGHAPSQQWADRTPPPQRDQHWQQQQQPRPGWQGQAHSQQWPDRNLAPQHGWQQQQQQQHQQEEHGWQGHASPQQQQHEREGADSRFSNVPSWAQPALNRPSIDFSRPPAGQLSKEQLAERFGQARPEAAKPAPAKKPPKPKASPRIMLRYDMSVKQLAGNLGVSVEKLMASMAEAGDAASSEEERVPLDTAELMAMEYGHIPTVDKTSRAPDLDAEPRSAVVTVMGHVDHGKTTLLDALRSTSVAAGEAGGITQHIGAFEVVMPGSKTALTFLDTPGHAAFSAMRARGAAVTDIAVVVVAADDGVMPQTKEALRHAKAANVPVVIGLTKCDAPGADTRKCINQLLAESLPLEEAGGDIQVVELAAAKGKGLAELEEALMLQAEMMELKASKSCDAEGLVVEAKVDRTQGPAATVVVRRGTLKPGQHVVIGTEHGRVRALRDAAGKPLKQAGPGQPAEIIGLRGVPHAGDELMVVSSEERAKLVSQARTNKAVEFRHAQSHQSVVEASSASEEEVETETVMLPLIIQADVHGSVEALKDSIEALSTETVRIKILHMGVGPVSKANIDEASMTSARIIAFNVKTNGPGVEAANKEAQVEISSHRVIYHLLEEVRAWTQAMTPKVEKEVVLGEADVLQVFPVNQKGEPATSVAGCRVSVGSINAAHSFRVLRNGEQVHMGPCSSIRRHKLGVERVGKGTECGLLLTGYADFQPGDRVECFEIQLVDADSASPDSL